MFSQWTRPLEMTVAVVAPAQRLLQGWNTLMLKQIDITWFDVILVHAPIKLLSAGANATEVKWNLVPTSSSSSTYGAFTYLLTWHS